MSSADTNPHLEDSSSLDDQENNEFDEEGESQNISNTESQKEIEKKIKNKYLKKMIFILKELLIMVVVAVTYAAIANDPPKVGKSPAAYRFFSDDTYVTDWYRGEISDAINQARNADLAFVMFYAPWDAESQYARTEFQRVARYMHKEVTFSAVNCWQPGSECRTQYNKVHKWPVLIAYPTHGRGIQYNGPLVAIHMMAFLKKLISPFIKNNISLLMAQHDAVIFGRVNAAPYSREYSVFYRVALRLLERDPLQEIAVSFDTGTPYPFLAIHMWNETLIYSEDEWEVEPILNWIIKHVRQINTWISPSGSKSISLSNYLEPGPALIMFTPRNPIVIHNDFYSMLREIAYDYNDSGDNLRIKLIKSSIGLSRRHEYFKQLKNTEQCKLRELNFRRENPTNLWSNTSYCFGKKYHTEKLQKNDNMMKYYGGVNDLCMELLKNIDNVSGERSKYNHVKSLYTTSKLSDREDYRSPHNLKNVLTLDSCISFLIAQKYFSPVFSSELFSNDIKSFNVTGLKFKTNKTLNFIAMDSLYYYHYAEKLGIDLSKKPNKTAVVILDNKMESHYVMAEDVTESNVRNFIYNYTVGSLTRALSSLASVKSGNTHSYPNNRLCSFKDGKFCVKELSADNFLQAVSQTDKAVIIFYYSKQCSFCNGISYRFLTVAKYFSPIVELQFARVDGDLNLLPWEYTMEVYPTILFIPAYRESDSRVFPMDMPINLKNLIGFILANLQPSLRLEAMWTLCVREMFNSESADCIKSLRLQIFHFIEKSLQEWRTSDQKNKAFISSKLQYLHDLHTLFLQTYYNTTVAVNLLNKLKFLELESIETSF